MAFPDDDNDAGGTRIPVRIEPTEAASGDAGEAPRPDSASREAQADDDAIELSVEGLDEPPLPDPSDEIRIPRSRFVLMGQEKLRLEERIKALQGEAYQAKAAANAADEKLNEEKQQALRSQAELQNYRRRIDREREEAMRYVHQDLLMDILPVLDNFHRALMAPRTPETSSDFDKGVELIYRQLTDTLARHDLQSFDAVGKPFDPNVHEAVTRVETTAVPADHVTREMRKGYRYKDRMLRPALVEVSLAPAVSDVAKDAAADDGNRESAVAPEE